MLTYTDPEGKELPSRLWGMRCYLIGAMDQASDGGVQWREIMAEFLSNLGVVPLNPCDKPIQLGFEDIESRKLRQSMKDRGDYDLICQRVRELRTVDLRMVDMSDFIIFNLDIDIPTCGSWEEMGWANRLKKPVLIRCKQGKNQIPDWTFGMIPHQHIFGNWEALKSYLVDIHSAPEVDTMKRWMFFEYHKMLPTVTREQSIEFAMHE